MSDNWKNEVDKQVGDLDYGTRAGFWYANKWVWASVLAVLAVIAGVWFASVLVARPQGAGDAYKQNQSGTNRIAKQEWFEQTYADIQAADQNIGVLYTAKVDDPSYVNKTNYTGAVLACNQLVQSYDAEARKYTSKDWRGNDLPSVIDQTNPKFDCKEAKK